MGRILYLSECQKTPLRFVYCYSRSKGGHALQVRRRLPSGCRLLPLLRAGDQGFEQVLCLPSARSLSTAAGLTGFQNADWSRIVSSLDISA